MFEGQPVQTSNLLVISCVELSVSAPNRVSRSGPQGCCPSTNGLGLFKTLTALLAKSFASASPWTTSGWVLQLASKLMALANKGLELLITVRDWTRETKKAAVRTTALRLCMAGGTVVESSINRSLSNSYVVYKLCLIATGPRRYKSIHLSHNHKSLAKLCQAEAWIEC